MKNLKMQLCLGRHDCPDAVDGAIFPVVVENIHDYEALYETAARAIPLAGCRRLTVYVTGLTPCLCAVVNVCYARGIMLTCAHYDRDTGTYKMQHVL